MQNNDINGAARKGDESADPFADRSGLVVWLTGLPAAGKTTLARGLERVLSDCGHQVCVLDGDELRAGLNSDLGFSEKDRAENVRRTSEVAGLFAQYGFVAIVALISPYMEQRCAARYRLEQKGLRFVEIFVDAPLAVCEARDPVRLYARSRSGEIKGVTGIDAPYEPPQSADLVINTDELSVSDSVARICRHLNSFIYVSRIVSTNDASCSSNGKHISAWNRSA